MAIVENHKPGSFCWIELATSDQNAAKDFYGALFQWTAVDSAMGPSEFYTMFMLEGRNAAAAYTIRPEQRSQGVPPHWMIYIAVDNANETAKRAGELGAKILAPPFDVFDYGRMAVIQDPTGAIFSIWEKKKHAGIGIAGVPGTLCWADLIVADPETAKKFYSDLFGWKISAGDKDASGYLHIMNGGDGIGGIPPAAHRDPKTPPHWLAYFAVEDVDATSAKAQQHGARTYVAPMSIEHVGRMAVLADPQGAVFAIFKSARHG